jgi:hypothetical protein
MGKATEDRHRAEMRRLIGELPSYALDSLPGISAICFFLADDGECLYIGSSTNVSRRWDRLKILLQTGQRAVQVALLQVTRHRSLHYDKVETIKALMIDTLHPRYNSYANNRRALLVKLKIGDDTEMKDLIWSLVDSDSQEQDCPNKRKK